MKKFLFTLALAGGCLIASAQEPEKEEIPQEEGYVFTDLNVLPTNSIKNQYRSGTCWCFSTLSFLEDEIRRVSGEEVNLSVMWIVRNIYFEKAVKYVRLHGSLNFAVGGASHDVTNGIRSYGIVPEEVYPGLNYGSELPEFNEIDAVLKAYVDAVIATADSKGGKLTTAWQRGLNGILDAYFGVMPDTFTYKGKTYTPQSFAASLPIQLDDYIDITSYTHHPFYTTFAIEVPDNWSWGTCYNVPLDEMMSIIDNSLDNGYTVAWGTDVSEKGFSRTKAIAIVPEMDITDLNETDAARWGDLSPAERDKMIYTFDKPGREKTITQEMRQEAFDNYETTDDHGMVIIGTAVDQNGNPYYKVKNSWGVTASPYDGFYYFSRPFVAYKTMSLMVNKKALPKEIRKKLGIKK
ncbi:MAG: aminopeptidase [Porphyromonadaceae bacterium]|nr:aminopeptidase [Porphyromonadaceae bacterium]MCD8287449.1 aminopeptidase [Porphyromonadaceae bacterium]